MAVWSSFAAMAVLAVIGPVLAQDSPAVVMPGVSIGGSISHEMSMRRRRPVRVQFTPAPDAQTQPGAESASLWAPIFFPTNLQGMFDDPATVALPAEDRTADGDSRPVMVMTDDMDIDKLDLGYLRTLNSISSMEEFAQLLGVEVPVPANSSNGIAARFGGGIDVELPPASCRPEEKSVKLDIPHELNVVYYPSCVRLQRCGGCCLGSMLKCRPTKTEAINIKVMRVASSTTTRTRSSGTDSGRGRPGSSGRAATSRRRRRQVAEMITVAEEQHTECDCLCRVQEQDCDPALQEYVPDNCRCQCRNIDEQEKCDAKPMTHYWDDDQCTCFCLKTVNCSVTLRFDHTSCSCVQIPQNLPATEGSGINPRVGLVSGNGVDEENERFRRDRIPVVFGRSSRREGRPVP